MERLRRQHNAQWYHETQSSVRGDAPLEPQAATLRDRFLLGLGAFADEALNAALGARAGYSTPLWPVTTPCFPTRCRYHDT